jgi:hypothetical protein
MTLLEQMDRQNFYSGERRETQSCSKDKEKKDITLARNGMLQAILSTSLGRTAFDAANDCQETAGRAQGNAETQINRMVTFP